MSCIGIIPQTKIEIYTQCVTRKITLNFYQYINIPQTRIEKYIHCVTTSNPGNFFDPWSNDTTVAFH